MLSGFHVVDGGLGSEMIRRGIDAKDDPLWSAKGIIYNPDEIRNIHKSFLESGADIILTASYQASIDGFCRYEKCSQSEARSFMKKSVLLAKQACLEFLGKDEEEWSTVSSSDGKPLIGGSVGPYGACLCDGSEYNGKYTDEMSKEEMMKWHRPRIEILVEAGVDFLAVETIPALKEAEAILQVIKEFPNTSCWVTFSCKDERHLCHGETFYQAATTIAKYDQGLLSSIRGQIEKPLVVYPNSEYYWEDYCSDRLTCGSQQSSVARLKTPGLASYVPEWLKEGATIVGGCCGSTPADINDIRKALMDWADLP